MDENHEEVIREVRKNADYKGRIERLESLLLNHFERAALSQLFMSGPTSDGDIVVKSGRDSLFERGYATRINGWSFLTPKGVEVALALTLDREKERRNSGGSASPVEARVVGADMSSAGEAQGKALSRPVREPRDLAGQMHPRNAQGDC